MNVIIFQLIEDIVVLSYAVHRVIARECDHVSVLRCLIKTDQVLVVGV